MRLRWRLTSRSTSLRKASLFSSNCWHCSNTNSMFSTYCGVQFLSSSRAFTYFSLACNKAQKTTITLCTVYIHFLHRVCVFCYEWSQTVTKNYFIFTCHLSYLHKQNFMPHITSFTQWPNLSLDSQPSYGGPQSTHSWSDIYQPTVTSTETSLDTFSFSRADKMIYWYILICSFIHLQ